MLIKLILYCGQPMAVGCDERCDKAWGINTRRTQRTGPTEDDFEYHSDLELGSAPADPGTHEGDQSKPRTPDDRLNKWCVRECERCAHAAMGMRIALPDLRFRLRNKS